MRLANKKLLLLISLGSILEYYDFAIFIYLAPIIGKSLIPIKNHLLNLILSYAIFAIGAFFRPLGGMIFAHLGDTRGRKQTFIFTILLMALPTLLIAFIPNKETIGTAAVICLVILRICQGLAIGGEIPGSITFGYELSASSEKAFNSSIVILGSNIGFFLASAVCTVLLAFHFVSFESWRLAFVLGGFFGVGSYFLRKNLIETPAFAEYKNHLKKEIVPIKLLFANYKKPIFQLLGIGCFLSSCLAVFTFYMPIYLASFYHFPLKRLMEFNSYTIIIFILGSLSAGLFDKYFSKKFFLGFTGIFIVASFGLFFNYAHLTINQILFFHAWFLLGIGIVCGRLPVICATFFPVAVRYSGIAFVYNLCFGIVAGSTQMVLTWLIKVTGLIWIPALYLFIFGVFFIGALLSIRNKELTDYQN